MAAGAYSDSTPKDRQKNWQITIIRGRLRALDYNNNYSQTEPHAHKHTNLDISFQRLHELILCNSTHHNILFSLSEVKVLQCGVCFCL